MDGIVKQIQELEQIESSVTFQTNQLLKNLTYTPNEDFDPEHYDNLNDLNGNLKAFALNIYKHYHVIS
jgi:hypothetical protein